MNKMPQFMDETLRARLVKIYKDKLKAVNNLTEQQFEEAMVQAVLAGDFVRYVTPGETAQQVVYIPYHERERLEFEVKELNKQIEELSCEIIELHQMRVARS